MSHQPARKENDCLNCGHIVEERYCSHCGQENLVTHYGFIALLKHFVFDLFHFDGKFFTTLGRLFSRPGLVPADYISGKRIRYLDPFRMYLFTSAFFFLIFFTFFGKVDINDDYDGYLSPKERMKLTLDLTAWVKRNPSDSFARYTLNALTDSSKAIVLQEAPADKQDSVLNINNKKYTVNVDTKTGYEQNINGNYSALDRWLESKGRKIATADDEGLQDFSSSLVHNLPYLLFISLPFFALLLKLLYAKNKRFFYSDHFIFTLYHYIFSFILMLLFLIVTEVRDATGWKFIGWILFALFLYWVYYLYRGMRNFYQQSRGKTLVKLIVLNFFALFVMVALFIGFVIINVMNYSEH